MSVSLSQIRTLRDVYQASVLYAATDSASVRYEPSGILLDRVSLYQGDLAKLQVDAIVNAANSSLLGGGGGMTLTTHAMDSLPDASHQLTALFTELLGNSSLKNVIQTRPKCRTLDGCQTGDAKITKGYELPAKHVIHTVGPIYSSKYADDCAVELASCYRRSLEVAVSSSLKHAAFPSISTGVYGYPIKDATHIALDTVRHYLENEKTLERVVFVVWSDQDRDVYKDLIPLYFPPEVLYE